MFTFDWPRRKHNDAAFAAAGLSPTRARNLDLDQSTASHGGSKRGKHMIALEDAGIVGEGGAGTIANPGRSAAAA
jgi:hypothetical protein